ncbi:MAG: adenosylcobinamide-phosphate synthase CbiB [Rhodospirillales bacterium]|nr:adenosylcobinamide-phosphate synthase CbiB [Rhodospirillales bacterium]
MFLFGLSEGRVGFDPLVLLLLALVVDGYLGVLGGLFSRIPHPVVIIGNLIGALDRKLNKDRRSQMDRAFRGLIVVIIIVSLAGSVGWCIAWLGQNYPFGWIIELVLLISLIAQRSLYTHVKAVKTGIEESGLEGGREAVSHIVGRDPLQLDEHGVCRAAIESLAENFGDGVVAPVFWYALFGFPGILIYKAVNTMDSMIGYRTEKYKAFGMTAARLDDILNLIPARLAGIFISIAAIAAPKANPWRAFKTMLRDAGKHRSPNAGWPEGAMAGALDLALAGPRKYREKTVNDDWIGTGKARATMIDIKRALYVYGVACLVNAGVVACLFLVRMS